MTYKQCILESKTHLGLIKQTAWIPSNFAIVNKVVTLKDDTVTWIVRKVGTIEIEWDEVNKRSQDYKKQREASDI